MPYWLLPLLVYTCFVEAPPLSNPGPRESANLIYFPPTKKMVLVDGFVLHPDSGRNEVWSWDGNNWTVQENKGPDTKTLSSGAFDSKLRQIVVFGGVGKRGYESLHGDAWAFDGNNWKKENTNPIGTRDHHKMVYADHLDAFVMYGGQDSLRKNDSTTWLLKDSKWTKLTIPGPGARYHFGLSYDVARKKVVLYGGYNSQGLMADTWEFDGNQWQKIDITGPGPRGRFMMTYDSDRKMVLLFGGDVWKKKVDKSVHPDGEIWDLRGDLWGYDGKQWQKISDQGPARMMAALGYDPSRKTVVVYGGGGAMEETYADTWEFSNGQWIKKEESGAWKWNGSGYERIK